MYPAPAATYHRVHGHPREIVGALEALSDGVTHADLGSWTEERMPPQTRFGLFQSRLGNSAAAWRVRTHPAVRDVFTKVFSGLRGEPVREFVTSVDGVNVRPPVAPFYEPDGDDWAHFDLTRDEPEECVQGQVVLTDTTAGFRCSPRSHLLHTEVVTQVMGSLENQSDWCLLPKEKYEGVRARVEALGGAFQVPILAPKGSMILWLSATLHSAKAQDRPAAARRRAARGGARNALENFRVVVYVCFRPAGEVDEAHFARVREAFECSLTTCHSGRKTFPRTPRARRGDRLEYTAMIRDLMGPAGDRMAIAPPLDDAIESLITRRL